MTGVLLVATILAATSAAQVLFKLHHVARSPRALVAAVALFVAVVPLSYLAVRQVGLATLYVFMSLSYGIVAFLGQRLFGERVPRMQAAGIALVVLGCFVYNL